MTIEAIFKLPFIEQETFFKKKLNIPTQKWDDLWKDQHAKGFMIAGAYKADLLADFRDAVDKAISQGITLADFRKDFDNIVARHGWSYKGGRNWRSEVIYSTNIRTAYSAGRWEQLQDPDVKKFYGYLEYRHGDSRVPRPQHLAWNGLVLSMDDPWWKTHYPPNGWGCKCRVFAATKEDYAQADQEGLGTAPPSPIDPKTGEQVGIDKGWGYNVGTAAEKDYGVLADKFESLPPDIGRQWMDNFLKGPTFQRFFEGMINEDFPVAVLTPADREVLGSETQTVWLSPESLKKNKKSHRDIGLDDFRMIPKIIDAGEAYRQSEERLIFLKEKEKLYRVGIKRTRDKSANFMLSLFETTTERAMKQVIEKYERIR
ncbi:MAG: phage minor head protein [Pseudomonadota bacterium]